MVAALLEELTAAHKRAFDKGNEEPDGKAEFQYAIVDSVECVTGRHLFETTIRKVAEAIGLESFTSRCENLAQLTFELSTMLKYPPQPEARHFVLAFDGVDRQKEAPPTLLPALARLSEIVRLTSIPKASPLGPKGWTNRILTKDARFPVSRRSSS